MYPPTAPAISAPPMKENHVVAPKERTGGGAGGTTTMSFFGEIRPSSTGPTLLVSAADGPGLHGGSGLNSVLGDNNGSAPFGPRAVLGANTAGPCSDGPLSAFI